MWGRDDTPPPPPLSLVDWSLSEAGSQNEGGGEAKSHPKVHSAAGHPKNGTKAGTHGGQGGKVPALTLTLTLNLSR